MKKWRNKDRNQEARKFGRKKHLSEKKTSPFHPGSWLKKCEVLVLVWVLVAHLSWSIHTRGATYRVTYKREGPFGIQTVFSVNFSWPLSVDTKLLNARASWDVLHSLCSPLMVSYCYHRYLPLGTLMINDHPTSFILRSFRRWRSMVAWLREQLPRHWVVVGRFAVAGVACVSVVAGSYLD